jgi:hypothetical protein
MVAAAMGNFRTDDFSVSDKCLAIKLPTVELTQLEQWESAQGDRPLSGYAYEHKAFLREPPTFATLSRGNV